MDAVPSVDVISKPTSPKVDQSFAKKNGSKGKAV